MPRRIKTFSEEQEDYWWEDWESEQQFRRSNSKNNTAREIEKLLREMERLTRPHNYYPKKKKKDTSGSGGSYKGFSGSYKQRCIIKCSYEKDSIAKHKAFLREYIPQENKEEVKEKPVLFSKDEDVVSDHVLIDYEKVMDSKFFRFIISPENQSVPIKVLVRNLMKKVEAATGYELYWFAGQHDNTGHGHCHLLINGKDKNGKDVKFDKYWLKYLFRETAQDICTELVGFRTKKEIDNEMKKMPYSKRFCRIDAEIKKASVNNSIGKDDDYTTSVVAKNSDMQLRLLFLTELGFAKKIGKGNYPGRFVLEKNWEDKLRALGNYNSFLAARNNLLYTKGINLELYKPSFGKINGVITHIYKHDIEESWSNAIVIEDKQTRKAYFVPLRNVPNDKLFGATVEFGSRNNGKQIIANNLKVIEWSK